MKALVAVALVACGGGGAPPAHAVAASDAGVDAASTTAGGAARDGDPSTSLEALAARGASDAPLMRELVRVDRLAASTALPRADRDTCVRAVFAASREVRVWFADESGAMRGDATSARTGAVPPRGPACAKKGETLKLMLEARGGEGAARAVIFAAP